jgi:hypothetical protein
VRLGPIVAINHLLERIENDPGMDAPPLAPEFSAQQIAELARIETLVVPGRTCGSCSMCCKVVDIPEMNKPAGGWCSHCIPGRGCSIYDARPYVCRGAYCEWITCKGLGPEWKPDKAKFLLFKREGGRHLTAHVDVGHAGAWRRSPYYENLKAWAAAGVQKPEMDMVDVMIGERTIVILPDRDVEIGVVAADEVVTLERQMSSQGVTICVRKTKRQPALA